MHYETININNKLLIIYFWIFSSSGARVVDSNDIFLTVQKIWKNFYVKRFLIKDVYTCAIYVIQEHV